jgi:hypothetical protein
MITADPFPISPRFDSCGRSWPSWSRRGHGPQRHEMLIPAIGLLQGLRLSPYTPVLGLKPRLRRRECNARGKAVVSITVWRAAK